MKYLLTLKNGETREIKILEKPLFACSISGEGNIKYRTMKEMSENINIKIIDETDPHYLYQDYVGVIRNEGVMFDIYKALRTPIIRLELIDE